jgi:hypothetical protein
MHRVPKPHTRTSRQSLMAAFLVVCAAFALAVPQMAWSQAGTTTSQSKASTEGDRLLDAGIKAYQQGQVAEASRLWENARAVYNRDLGEDHPNTLTAMNNLAVTYSDLGQDDKALVLKERTLKLRRARLGEDHPDTLASMNNLANTYDALGQHDKALALNEQTLKLMRAKLGEDHPDTLTSMNSLALTYYYLGQNDTALALGLQTLKLRRATLGEDHPDTLTSMNSLAATYINLGQHDKALALNEQTLKLRRAKLGEDHPDTLTSMSNLAVTYSERGQHEKALALKDQTLKLRRAKLGEDHPETLGAMSNLAITHGDLGQHDKALALNEQTLKLMRAKHGEDHPETLGSMGNLAITYGALGQHDKALELNEQTLQIRRAKLGEDHPNTLASMGNLANTYVDLGQDDKALALQEQTLKRRRAKLGEDHPETIASMGSLANTYSALGQHGKALALKEQALQLTRAKLGEDHPGTLTAMHNLAVTYSVLDQHDKALVLGEETLKLMRAKLGEDHPVTLASMSVLADTYRALDQHDKALVLGEQTLKLKRTKLGEDHPNTLGSMTILAIIYDALGQHDKALTLNEQTLQLMRAKLGVDHPRTLDSMTVLANTYHDLGQHDKALALREQTLKLKRAKLGEDHPGTLASMNNLANTYRALGQHDKALALIPGIVGGAERLRALPGLATEQQQSIFAKYSDNYQWYAKWYAGAKRSSDAFNLGDLSKARTLTDSIKVQAALRSLPSSEQQKLQASESRAQTLQANIDKLSAQGTRDSGAVLALQMQLDVHKADHLKLVADLTSRYPKYAQITNIKAATASQARQLLGSGDVFVSYLVTTKGMAQAFVLDASGEAIWVDLGQIKDHANLVATYRELVAPSTGGDPQRLVALKDGAYLWLKTGQALPVGASIVPIDLKFINRYWHDTLIKPILPLAGPYQRWIISPDKDLALLPFDTLVETFDAAGEPAQTLVQTRNITLVQSFAVYALLKQREADYATVQRPKELFAMGNAVYGDGWAEARGIRRGAGTRGFAPRSGDATGRGYAVAPMQSVAERSAMDKFTWQNLPGTAQEIRAVSAVFSGKAQGGGANVDTHVGPEASEGKLQQINATGRLKDYRYLLFSAHGYLAQNPALSSLVLSQQGNPPEIDGYVTAGEWPLYDVRSDLTVLSACDTGVGRTQAGESVMGLPYALFVAGNKNTLLSLWPVDDDATAEFMRRFFTKLKAGTSQPDALRETKQEFRQHSEWSDPRFWAAFVLYGV